MGNTFSGPAGNLGTYQEITKAHGDVGESMMVDTSGFQFKFNRGITPQFQVSHALKVQQPNPLAQMIPGQPEAKSNYSFGGTLVTDMVNNEPRLISHFEYMSDSEINIQTMKQLSENSKMRLISGHSPSMGGTSLIREMTVDVSKVGSTASFTLASPKILDKSGPTFEGVAMASFMKSISDKINLGAECMMNRRNNPREGIQTMFIPGLALQYVWPSKEALTIPSNPQSAKLTSEAESVISLACSPNSLIPTSLNLLHWAKGGKSGCNQAIAELTIGQDPTPVQMGGTGGIQASGSIGYMMKIEDPDASKPQPGMPPAPSGSTVKAKLTSGLDCVASIEACLAPLPATVCWKATYNLKTDKLKMGASLNIGQ